MEGCTEASGVDNKDGYSVGCGDNDGNIGGVRPLFLLDLWNGKKRWKIRSDGDGVLFYFLWCRSDGCGSENDAYNDGNGQLASGDFLSVDISTSASECEHGFSFNIFYFLTLLIFLFYL